jgi:hypothetical protein
MYLGEVLQEKESLLFKIQQLEQLFFKVAKTDSDKANELIKKLFDLLDKYRSHLILINKINNKEEIVIGDSKINLANAVLLRDTLERKIEILNRLILEESAYTDVSSLIENRDKFQIEYKMISNELKSFEWRMKID